MNLSARRWIAPDLTQQQALAGNDETKKESPHSRVRSEDEEHERELIRQIRQKIAENTPEGASREQQQAIAREIARRETAALPKARREAIIQEIVQSVGGGLGPLQPFIDDPAVTEIMVNAPDQVFIERNGEMVLTNARFRSDEDVQGLVERIVGEIGRRFDLSNPMVDARLRDGSRVNAIRPPLALRGTAVTIRKFPRAFSFDDLVAMGSIPTGPNEEFDVAAALLWAVPNRLNIVVSGGTGSGKTTLLNALTGLIPHHERLVIIEDAAELQPQQPHVVRLETRPPTVEGKGEVRIRQLLVNALRMRPDRIIVGEVRSDEVVDMLQAMNTGHPGSMTTVHANSTRDCLTRLETMVLMGSSGEVPLRAVRQQIASAIHLIVQIARTRLPDGTVRRWVTELSAMRGLDPA
ncbi:MAG TPA: CpaF family protein, partial [Calditerricola sp.]